MNITIGYNMLKDHQTKRDTKERQKRDKENASQTKKQRNKQRKETTIHASLFVFKIFSR